MKLLQDTWLTWLLIALLLLALVLVGFMLFLMSTAWMN